MARQKDDTPSPRTTPRPRKAAVSKTKAQAKTQRKATPPARATSTPRTAAPKTAGTKKATAVERAKLAAKPAAVETPVIKKKPAGKARVAAPPAPVRRSTGRRVRVKVPATAEGAQASADWSEVGEQERVGAAKYGARPSGRGFDEQRFLFPRNYEVNRVRLVVRDPEWLFAYWDVNPRAFEGIRREMGERAMALSRLTLKVSDPEGGPAQVILLPYGARSWYVRIDPGRPRYMAELGITLPSGQFRPLAQSNVVAMPRFGPSSQPAARSVPFREAWAAAGDLSAGVSEEGASGAASAWTDPGTSIRQGPLPEDIGGASDRLSAEMSDRHDRESGRSESRGGASDIFRR